MVYAIKIVLNEQCTKEFIFKMATNKGTRNPKKAKNNNESIRTKEQIITQYLRTQLEKSIVTPEYVEKYAEIQGQIIRETNKLFTSGKYRFGLQCDILIPVKIETVLSYRQFYAIETRYLKIRARVQNELARIYRSDGEPFVDVVIGDICAINKNHVWYRGEVIRIIPNVNRDKTHCSVRLLDFGRVVRTNERRLRLLKGWLVHLSALAIACNLTNLNEEEDDILMDHVLVAKLFNQLEKIATNSEKVLIYLVSTKAHSDFGYINEVYLFADCETDANVSNAAYLTHETFGAFNPMKIEFREPLCTEWLQKDFKVLPQCPGSQFGRKYAITITHIESPSYFYVQMKCQTELLQKIQKKMEHYVGGYDPRVVNTKIKWKVGYNCLCLDDRVWHRGQIQMVPPHGRYYVFLRDNGRVIAVTKKCMLRMPIELLKHPDCVQKCHLDVSTEWLNENADDFRKLLQTYKSFAVSTNSGYDNGTMQSVGVTLFGTSSEPYLENDQAWENIGTRIISKSIMKSLEYFIEKTQYYYRLQKYWPDNDSDSDRSFDHVLLLKRSMASIKSYQTLDSIKQQATQTIFWPPAEPLMGTTFVASIAHISDEGVFHIQLESDLHLVCQINRTIDAIVNKLKDQNHYKTGQWKDGMACYARSQQNDLPNEYYRATIKSIDWIKKECVVLFVDYGNYGCSNLLCDLYVAWNFGDIPSLAHPYYLRDVIATSDTGKWNPEILGPCRDHLVDKIVVVNVEHENDNLKPIVPCKMYLVENNTNLFDWLIIKQLNNGSALDDDDELIVNV